MKTKILGLTLGIAALALLASTANASTAQIIQPAGIIYNENMTVNGSLQVSSLRVGYEGVGGVTYFNGTIVNAGLQVPVTIGDDLRIDGRIWRGPSKGQADDQPLVFADSLVPTDTNAFNLGFSKKRWKDLYLAGLLYGEDIIVGKELWGGTKKGIVDGDDPLFVSDSMYPTMDNINNLGSNKNRWLNLHLSGMLQGVDINLSGSLQGNNAKFSGLLEGNDAKFTGDVDFSGATVTGLAASSTDADTLDGIDSTGFALVVHDHDDDYVKIEFDEPEKRYWSINGSEFIPMDETWTYTKGLNGGLYNTDDDFSAPVNLPTRAVVKRMLVRYLDNDAINDFKVKLNRINLGENSTQMAEFTSDGQNSSFRMGYISTITNETIINENYGYQLYVSGMNGTNTHILGGVIIEYEITKPLP